MSLSLRLLLSLCVVFILAYVIFNIHQVTQKPANSPKMQNYSFLVGEPGSNPNIFELVTIQVDPSHPLNPTELMKGHNGFLMYKNKGDDTIYLFNTLSSLAKFDSNKDGLISATDPEYSNMYFAFYDPASDTFKYFPLDKAGVRAVAYESKYLEQEDAGDPSRFATQAGTATLSDGSKNPMMVVPVPAGQLNTKSFSPVQNKE
ncbi:MAG: hypothetical protein JSS53_06455 [Proteobacteria bacterium]|nr:hypothetical protein [Pseudomonadota bacterium]